MKQSSKRKDYKCFVLMYQLKCISILKTKALRLGNPKKCFLEISAQIINEKFPAAILEVALSREI